jgi:hypothetical protein
MSDQARARSSPASTFLRLPGEYRVNFGDGAEATERTVETIDVALDLGRAMAAPAKKQGA